MSLVLGATVTLNTNCKGFSFTQTTGVYNATTNPGGFGSPNPATTDVDESYLVIENATTGITYDNIDITAVSTTTATSVDSADLKVSGVSIGDVALPNGEYTITHYVVVDSDTYTVCVYKLWLCVICCKLSQLAAKISSADCNTCDGADQLWTLLETAIFYKAMIEAASSCGNSAANVTVQIQTLENMLSTLSCSGC